MSRDYLANSEVSDKDVINALIDVSLLITKTNNTDELFKKIHQIIGRVIFVKNIAIAEVHLDVHKMTLRYFVDEKDGSAYQGKTIDIGQGLSDYTIKSKGAISLNANEIRNLQESGEISRIYGTMCSSWIGVPIRHEDETLGLVIVQSYDSTIEYSDRDLEVLTFVGTNIGILLKQRQIMEEENEMRDQLVQKEKLASLGELVAGVAHEINTPLGVCVTGMSNLIDEHDIFTKSVAAGTVTETQFHNFMEDVGTTCEIVKSNVERAAKLISSFKQIAVDQSSEDNRVINLNEYIHEVIHSLHPIIRKTKHVIKVDCPSDIILTTQAGALSQLFTNLITNSLIHGFEHIDSGEINISAFKTSQETILNYNDNGKGMSAEHQKKFFQPFFTTKRNTGGSGLGGHIIYNIVENVLGGTSNLETSEENGFNLNISFPIRDR
jgi:two-component system, NtrC family, sensor kinase